MNLIFSKLSSCICLTHRTTFIHIDCIQTDIIEMFNVNHFIISQANPHAVMLASFNVNKSIWSNRVMGLMTGVLLFLKKQVKEWLSNIIDLIGGQRIAPTWDTRRGFGSQFFTQEYEGRDIDISLIPWINHRSIFSALLHCIYNPTNDDFNDWVKAAERETWRYIPKIKSRVAVEMTLDKCVQNLRKQLVAESLEKKQAHDTVKMSNRVPSFFTSASLVNMSGLGITDSHNLDSEFNQNSEPNEERPHPVTAEIPNEVPPGWKGMGLRGNFSSGSLNRSGSGLFLMDEESEDDKSTISQKQLPGEVPSDCTTESVPLHHELHHDGYIKTSSMANFYYRKTSHGSLTNFSGDNKNDETS
jgi:hypothetical protein